MKKLKMNKHTQLPSNNNIRLLNQYLITKREAYYKNLQCGFHQKTWMNFAKTLLTFIQIINRR